MKFEDMEIKVAVFEDNKLVRDAFEAILNGTKGLICSGAFSNANDLLHSVKKSLPDVILMDIEMPGISGIEATRMIHQLFPDIKILIQTVFEENEKVFAAICAGASGYILKDTPPSKLVEGIHEVYNGGAPMSPAIASKVLALFQKLAPASNAAEKEDFHLSKREKEILALMIDGESFKSIAEKSFIGYETVRTHVKKIYKKLHVASSTEAVVKAIRHGLI
jgi:DNA-binding NarL/FixJ family response regulator